MNNEREAMIEAVYGFFRKNGYEIRVSPDKMADFAPERIEAERKRICEALEAEKKWGMVEGLQKAIEIARQALKESKDETR